MKSKEYQTVSGLRIGAVNRWEAYFSAIIVGASNPIIASFATFDA